MFQAALGHYLSDVNGYYVAVLVIIIGQLLFIRVALGIYLFYLLVTLFLRWRDEAEAGLPASTADNDAEDIRLEVSETSIQEESPIAEEIVVTAGAPRKTRVAVYIDGNNFYHNLKKTDFSNGQNKNYVISENLLFRHDKQFNFADFITMLCGQKECVIKKYFIGSVALNTQEGVDPEVFKNYKSNQGQHFAYLRKKGLEVVESILQFDGDSFKEKGVDTRLALVMYDDALADRYDEAILISSDNDFIPAIQFVHDAGKKVTVVGFRWHPPKALIKEADSKILVDAYSLRRYIQF